MAEVLDEFPRIEDADALRIARTRLNGPPSRRFEQEMSDQGANYVTPDCAICGGTGVREYVATTQTAYLGIVVASHPTNSLVVGDRVVVSPNEEAGKRWDWNLPHSIRLEDQTARVLIAPADHDVEYEWIPNRTVMVYMPEQLLRVRL
jgi:hypothetical protein